jgi:hypothetical protein
MFKEDLDWLNETNIEFKEKLKKMETKVDDAIRNISNKYHGAFRYEISINYANDTPNISVDLSSEKMFTEDNINEIKKALGAKSVMIQGLETKKIRLIFNFE